MIKPIIDILVNSPEVTSILTTDKIYPLHRLQGANLPCVVVQLSGTTPNDTQDAASTYDENRVSVTIFSETNKEITELNHVIRQSLDRYSGYVNGYNVDQIVFINAEEGVLSDEPVIRSVVQSYEISVHRDPANPGGNIGAGPPMPVTILNVPAAPVVIQGGNTYTAPNANIRGMHASVTDVLAAPGSDFIVPKVTVLDQNGLIVANPSAGEILIVNIGSAGNVIITNLFGADEEAKPGDTFNVPDVIIAGMHASVVDTTAQAGETFNVPPGTLAGMDPSITDVDVLAGETYNVPPATLSGMHASVTDLDAAAGENYTVPPVKIVDFEDAEIANIAAGDEYKVGSVLDNQGNKVVAANAQDIRIINASINSDVEQGGERWLQVEYNTPTIVTNFEGIFGCWSFRKRVPSYTGLCCTVRKVSDGTIHDIGFLPDGRVDTNALNALLLNGDSIKMTVWYDQSPLGWHMTQEISAHQFPLVLRSGDWFIEGDGVNHYMITKQNIGTLNGGGGFDEFWVHSYVSLKDVVGANCFWRAGVFASSTTNNGNRNHYNYRFYTANRFEVGQLSKIVTFTPIVTINTPYNLSVRQGFVNPLDGTDNNAEFWIDDVSQGISTTVVLGVLSADGNVAISHPVTAENSRFNGFMHELILHNDSNSDQRKTDLQL